MRLGLTLLVCTLFPGGLAQSRISAQQCPELERKIVALESTLRQMEARIGQLEKALAESRQPRSAVDQSSSVVILGVNQDDPDALYDSGRYEPAIQAYTHLLQQNPANPLAYLRRGYSYRMTGKLREAVQDYSEAIRLQPSSAVAYNNRGEVYQNLSEYPQAYADFSEAARLDPSDPTYRRNLANLAKSGSTSALPTTGSPKAPGPKALSRTPPPTSARPTAGSSKVVQVRGYYRKDGTYVPPHTRSAPRRK